MCRLEPVVMPIVARPPDLDPTRGSRVGDGTMTGTPSSRKLLPSDDTPAGAPAPTPRRVLALDALALLRRFRGDAAAEAARADPVFMHQVTVVRSQLAPIRTRDGLAASFVRESFQTRPGIPAVPEGSDGLPGPVGLDGRSVADAVRFAYAIRWLELGVGEAQPIWPFRRDPHGRGAGCLAQPRRRPAAVAHRRR